MADILLVEDSKDCQIIVKETLSKVANVRIAPSLREARIALSEDRFDLILLDVTLPDGDGFDFFSKIQSRGAEFGEIPVIFLTSKNETSMQVTAFSMGADDYIVKPLRPIEFRARVEAKLKKIVNAKRNEMFIVRGELRIDLGTQRASLGTSSNGKGERRELELTGREFKLLYHLARREGTVFSREQLIAAVWGGSVHVLDRTVDTHIYTLRKKLGDHSYYVESEVGMGYRLNTSRSKPRKLAA